MHWIIRINDGKNFKSSMKFGIWGITSSSALSKCFIKNAENGDVLWFLTNYKVGKKFIGVATFKHTKKREIGPLISFTKTNEELGWTEGDWDTEIHFTDLYMIEDLGMVGSYSSQFNILRTTSVKSAYDFENEYANIVKYSKAKKY